jgi:hypothetical protein
MSINLPLQEMLEQVQSQARQFLYRVQKLQGPFTQSMHKVHFHAG